MAASFRSFLAETRKEQIPSGHFRWNAPDSVVVMQSEI
jgi:hypothetical protein